MTFRADSFIRDVPRAAQATPEPQRREACLACDWLRNNRCYHPGCGCPVSAKRSEPWKNLARCGDQKWIR
jgi:hypothetical protein